MLQRLFVLFSLLLATSSAGAQEVWSGDFGAGFSLTRGNSDTKNLNLTLNLAQRISARDVAKYDAFYLRADTNGALTVDRTSFGARDELTLSPLTYAFGDVHYLRDRFKNIQSLITPSVGVGHHLIKTDALDLAVEAGAGLVVERDVGLPRDTAGALNAKQLLQWKFSPTATASETAAALWKANDIGDALYHLEAALAAQMTTRTQLKLSALDDYKTRPPAAGIKRNDISVIAAIVMKF